MAYACLLVAGLYVQQVSAQTNDPGQFALDVSPSPLVETVRPGDKKDLDLRIRNANTKTEDLKVELRAFKAGQNGEVELADTAPQEVASWVTFDKPTFKIEPGAFFTETIHVAVPENAGFSYTFAIVISRVKQEVPKDAQAAIRGSVAVFALLSVDRPGAARSFSVESLTSEKRTYEFLPAKFTVKLKNTGNTIVQPTGNIFIQRKGSSEPIAVLSLNPKGNYLVPDSGRTLDVLWDSGFPVYRSEKVAANAETQKKLVWDWSKAQDFRFGKYTAKLVAVYNDGRRDVPVVNQVEFWVIPWKLLVLISLVLIVTIIGLIVILKKIIGVGRRVGSKAKHHTDDD